MITTNMVELNGASFRLTRSDQFMIRKIGADEVYSEAYDIPSATYEYEETDIPIEMQDAEEVNIE
jgi:hypothetical protein